MVRPELDVAVIGSGPAGASAALPLARAGLKVAVIEKARLPRYKTCGGGVVGRAVRLLPVDIAAAVERECLRAELNLLDAGLKFTTARTTPIVAMTMRDRLDQMLTAAACSAGAELRESCELRDLRIGQNSIELETSGGAMRARAVIAADGVLSMTARRAGFGDDRRLIPALECELEVSGTEWQRYAGAARFDFGIVPYGYGWVFPKRDHLSIGVLTVKRGGVNLPGELDRYIKALGIDSNRGERHGALIPVAPRRGPLARNGVMLTGDTAGLADPVTGEGISFAILSGQLAAQAIIEAGLDPVRAGLIYERALQAQILAELKRARLLARLLYEWPRVRTAVFRRYGGKLSEVVTDLVMGERTYRSLLHNPVNYLKVFSICGVGEGTELGSVSVGRTDLTDSVPSPTPTPQRQRDQEIPQ